jgi:hypothetical protein
VPGSVRKLQLPSSPPESAAPGAAGPLESARRWSRTSAATPGQRGGNRLYRRARFNRWRQGPASRAVDTLIGPLAHGFALAEPREAEVETDQLRPRLSDLDVIARERFQRITEEGGPGD